MTTTKQQSELFTKYERARIIGARGLQLAMDAPLLVDVTQEDLERVNFDSLKLAELELDSGVLPISVKRPMPRKREGELKKVLAEFERRDVSDEEKEKIEKDTEKEISTEGEIMELATPEDEVEESTGAEGAEE